MSKINTESTGYTFFFAMIICVVCSFALSLVSEGLRPLKEKNVKIDIQKNILKAVALTDQLGDKPTSEIIEKVYKEKIKEMVIDEKGNVLEGKLPTDPDVVNSDDMLPIYIYEENGERFAYAFPIVGKGLWSTLRGYFALEPDAVTVKGITFYEHGETPGLGAEIEKAWFTDNYIGKKIWDVKADSLKPTTVVKGKVANSIAEGDREYYVDGISGATITSRGVSAMVDKWLNIYEPFFSKIRTL